MVRNLTTKKEGSALAVALEGELNTTTPAGRYTFDPPGKPKRAADAKAPISRIINEERMGDSRQMTNEWAESKSYTEKLQYTSAK